MTKLLISLLGAGVLATGGWAAASGLDDSQPARTVSLPGATSTDATTTTTTAATPAATTTTTTAHALSAPCDEAEHANDPRCTGGVATDDDRGDDDRSGSNSGKG